MLTKADLADTPGDYARAAAKLLPGLLVEVLDARDPEGVANVLPWCGRGRAVALVGSWGVGESTLVNTLIGDDEITTQGIREDDDRGRHTTTGQGTASPAGRRLAHRHARHA